VLGFPAASDSLQPDQDSTWPAALRPCWGGLHKLFTSGQRGAFSAMRWISAAPRLRPWSVRRGGTARLPASWSILCRLKKLQQILPRTCQGFLNPLLSTTAFFAACGGGFQYAL